MASLLIDRRFKGPASSGNGGYTAGALAEAAQLPGPVTVQLRRPPPLDTPLDVVATDDGVELRAGNELVAVAVPLGPEQWSSTAPVSIGVAREAAHGYAGFRSHPFPTCFSCGPDRAPGDGLRIFPGPLGDGRVAAPWTPDEGLLTPRGVSTPVTWAALDCVSAWASDLEHRPMVLAQMTARITSRPQAGATYALVGEVRRTDGRKTWTASTMFDADGRVVAQAEHLWVAVARTVVAQLQRSPEVRQPSER